MSGDSKALPAIPAKRYFTIGEVSELCGVKAYVLRYWEQEFTQLKPMKRRGNRRYYQHHEVLLIRRIRDLLYEQGFTISGARNQLTDSAGGHAHALASAPAVLADGVPDLSDDAVASGGVDNGELEGTEARNARPAAPVLPARPVRHADLLAADGDDETLEDATLQALARDDVATIDRARREFGDVAPGTGVRAPMPVFTSHAAGSVRAAALQAPRSAGSTPAPAPLDAVYNAAQVREELLAIRSMLVG